MSSNLDVGKRGLRKADRKTYRQMDDILIDRRLVMSILHVQSFKGVN